ncbi:proline-rich protein 2-like [Mustela nigripes]|uniref:proline-rich protein 2-like n=1 Tax=Mustela nigripes TaxID=77151 RepID=UPI002814D946|nr:proline-rich protein 2-like [Mustela nigripes]
MQEKQNQPTFLPLPPPSPSAATSGAHLPSLRYPGHPRFNELLIFRTPLPSRGKPEDAQESGPPGGAKGPSPSGPLPSDQPKAPIPAPREEDVHLRTQGTANRKSPRPRKPPHSPPPRDPQEGSHRPASAGAGHPLREEGLDDGAFSPLRITSQLASRSWLCAPFPPSPRPRELQRPLDPPPPPLKRRKAPQGRTQGEGA